MQNNSVQKSIKIEQKTKYYNKDSSSDSDSSKSSKSSEDSSDDSKDSDSTSKSNESEQKRDDNYFICRAFLYTSKFPLSHAQLCQYNYEPDISIDPDALLSKLVSVYKEVSHETYYWGSTKGMYMPHGYGIQIINSLVGEPLKIQHGLFVLGDFSQGQSFTIPGNGDRFLYEEGVFSQSAQNQLIQGLTVQYKCSGDYEEWSEDRTGSKWFPQQLSAYSTIEFFSRQEKAVQLNNNNAYNQEMLNNNSSYVKTLTNWQNFKFCNRKFITARQKKSNEAYDLELATTQVQKMYKQVMNHFKDIKQIF